MQTTIEPDSAKTLVFWWKVDSPLYDGYLKFYIDGNLQNSITGNVDWAEKTYNLSSGTHTLKWRDVNDSETTETENCGWVDYIQLVAKPWSGASSLPPDLETGSPHGTIYVD